MDSSPSLDIMKKNQKLLANGDVSDSVEHGDEIVSLDELNVYKEEPYRWTILVLYLFVMIS